MARSAVCVRRFLKRSIDYWKRIRIASTSETVSRPNDFPLTVQSLQDVRETREAFALRRIQWVLQRYREERIKPTRREFTLRSKVGRVLDVPIVQEAIGVHFIPHTVPSLEIRFCVGEVLQAQPISLLRKTLVRAFLPSCKNKSDDEAFDHALKYDTQHKAYDAF